MFLGKLLLFAFRAQSKKPTRSSPDNSVKRLIFDNKEMIMCVDFDGPVIIDNIHLLKKINSSDSTPVAALNQYIVEPINYMSRVQELKMTDVEDRCYEKVYKNACCKQIKIDLDGYCFNDKDIYLLKLQPLNSDEDLFTEEFVYTDGTFEHRSSSKDSSHRWYASSWPWIAIGFIILSAILFLLLLRLLCC